MKIIKKLLLAFAGFCSGVILGSALSVAMNLSQDSSNLLITFCAFGLAICLAVKYPKISQPKTSTTKRSIVDLTPIQTACSELITSNDPEMLAKQISAKFQGADIRAGLDAYMPAVFFEIEQRIRNAKGDPIAAVEKDLEKLNDFLAEFGISPSEYPISIKSLRREIAGSYASQGLVPRNELKMMYGEPPFIFQRGERLFFCDESVRIYETKTETSYKAGSRGVSVRIAKGLSYRIGNSLDLPPTDMGGTGLSYRIGNSRGKRIQEEVVDFKGIGTVAITTKNLYYLVDDRSVRIPLSKLVSVTQNGNEMELVKEATRPKPITFKFDDEQDARLMARIAKACDFY